MKIHEECKVNWFAVLCYTVPSYGCGLARAIVNSKGRNLYVSLENKKLNYEKIQ
jgi:hypothetical protein